MRAHMNDRKSRIGYATLVLLALVLIAAVMASNSLLRGMQIDLTENHLYTLSAGTKAVLEDIPEPVNLYLFYSNNEAKNVPFLRSYAGRVREMLDELAADSNGKLNVKVIDPEPFSEEEDRATKFGLQPVNLGTQGQNIFFGIAGTNSVGDTQKIPFLQPNKEAFLEYDLTRMIYSLAHPKKPVIGLLSGLPIGGGFDPQTQRSSQAWMITQQVRQLFDLRTLDKNVDKIDKDVDVLWLVHPQNLSKKTLYAIDQFVLGGGRALVFVDPLAQIAAPRSPIGGLAGMQRASSNLALLFKAWGVQYSPSQVVTDTVHALSVNAGYGKPPVRHIGLVGIDKGSMDQKDVITAGLDSINFADAGYFKKAPDAKIKFTPLIVSSKQSSLMPSIKMQFVSDPNQLLNDFVPSGKTYAIAARLEGHIDTAFPDGPPAAGDSSDADKKADADKNADAGKDAASAKTASAKLVSTGDAAAKPQAKQAGGQLKSTDKANIVLVADVDMLSDRMWVDRQSFLGQSVVTAFASNGDFVTNALDNLSGSAELIGLKSRATYSRPFTTVEALQRKADARFRAEQQRLQAELNDTKKKLSDLQASRSDKTSVLMTPAQQKEVQHFLDQQVQIREQLRKVQHNLNEDIEQLGTRLKIIDIGVMPILLTLIVFGIVYVRRRRPGHGA